MRVFHYEGDNYLVYEEKTREARIENRVQVDQQIVYLKEAITQLDIVNDDTKLLAWAKDYYEALAGLLQFRAQLWEKEELRQAMSAARPIGEIP